MGASNAGGAEIALLPVLTLQQAGVVNTVAGGARPACRKL